MKLCEHKLSLVAETNVKVLFCLITSNSEELVEINRDEEFYELTKQQILKLSLDVQIPVS